MPFEPFFFYTNLTTLKRFLVKYAIFPLPCGNNQSNGLSNDGQGNLLFWKNQVDIDTVTTFCQTEANDSPIVLQVLLPTSLANTADEFNIVRTTEQIPFFNVSNILYVTNPVRFLQGDTTLVIPTQLVDKRQYCPTNVLDRNTTEQAIAKYLPHFATTEIDLDDEFEDDDITSEQAESSPFVERIDKSDRLAAAYLMFVQGTTPFDYTLNPQLYYSLDGKVPYAEFINKTTYPTVPQTIVKAHCEKLDAQSRAYLSALKNSQSGNIDRIVYSAAIIALMQVSCSVQDKTRFLQIFSDELPTEMQQTVNDVFSDKRARNRIATLKLTAPSLASIYFLYTFWDYRFDRFCENMTEFELNSRDFANVTLSLWALLHGTDDVYTEYKNIELLYAVKNLPSICNERQYCLPYSEFAQINNVKNKGKIQISTLHCDYVNYTIEYHYCADEKTAEITKLVKELKCTLDDTFDFVYADLRKRIDSIYISTVDSNVIWKNRLVIHKKFNELIDNSTTKQKKPRTSRKKSKETARQQSIFDNIEE